MTTQEYDVDTINRLYAANEAMLEALEAIANYPDNPANADVALSDAIDEMQRIAWRGRELAKEKP